MNNYWTLLAAFAGSLIACSFLPRYSALAVLIGIFLHTSTGYYVATLVAAYLQLNSATQPGLAFVFAFTAKNLLMGLMRISDGFRRNPSKLWKKP